MGRGGFRPPGKEGKSRRVQLRSPIFPQGGWEEAGKEPATARKGRGFEGVVAAPQTNRGFKSKCLHSPSPPKMLRNYREASNI